MEGSPRDEAPRRAGAASRRAFGKAAVTAWVRRNLTEGGISAVIIIQYQPLMRCTEAGGVGTQLLAARLGRWSLPADLFCSVQGGTDPGLRGTWHTMQ